MVNVTGNSEMLRETKLPNAAELIEEKSLIYYNFPDNRLVRIRSSIALNRIMREIRRRTRAVGALPHMTTPQ